MGYYCTQESYLGQEANVRRKTTNAANIYIDTFKEAYVKNDNGLKPYIVTTRQNVKYHPWPCGRTANGGYRLVRCIAPLRNDSINFSPTQDPKICCWNPQCLVFRSRHKYNGKLSFVFDLANKYGIILLQKLMTTQPSLHICKIFLANLAHAFYQPYLQQVVSQPLCFLLIPYRMLQCNAMQFTRYLVIPE